MPFVYILTNKSNAVLYTGTTNNLLRRLSEHRRNFNKKSFSSHYHTYKLVYFEQTNYMAAAIYREKQIKAGSREAKVALIEEMNPEWRDLAEELFGVGKE